MKVYCRIQGLQGENGKNYNGRVGEIIDDEAAEDGSGIDVGANRTAASRVNVRVDGIWGPKSFKLQNLKVLSDSDSKNKAEHYTVSCSFNPADPRNFRFAMSNTSAGTGAHQSIILAGGGSCGSHATNLQIILRALKGHQSALLFNTPTVIHLSDLNIAVSLNKLLVGETDFLVSLPEHVATFMKDVVKLLKKNPHETFIKFTSNIDVCCPELKDQKPSFAGNACIRMDGSIEKPFEDKTEDVEGRRAMANFPTQYALFPPLAPGIKSHDDTMRVIDTIFKGIYHIYPNRSIENCFDVIYAGDGEHTIQMASFMNIGSESITEWYILAQAFGDSPTRCTAQDCWLLEPTVFWNIIMNFEDYREKEVDGQKGLPMVLPFLTVAPANNRKLLKKRTTAKDDEMDVLVPPANRTFSSAQEREQISDRHARIGAVLVMIELGRRRKGTPNQHIKLEVAKHLVGTDLAKDMEAALGYINDDDYQQAARVLNGGRICACCGISESEAVLSTCGACKVVDYCSKECQKKDYKPKHRKICGALGEERDGKPIGLEKHYNTHVHQVAPYFNAQMEGYQP